jgi:transposase-like protein
MVAAAIRTIFAQPDAQHVRAQSMRSPARSTPSSPDIASTLCDAGEDLLAFTGFPIAHWRGIWSTNPLERINGEIKRRTNVVGDLPNEDSIVPARHRCTRRDQRRMAAARTPRSLRGVNSQDRRTRHHRRGGALSISA